MLFFASAVAVMQSQFRHPGRPVVATRLAHEPCRDRVGARPRRAYRRCAALLSAGLLVSAGTGQQTEMVYSLDQHFGSIGFSVGTWGLFSSSGQFRRFTARLVLDPDHPERTRISVTVDATSVDMAWQQAATMVRSAEFFDVQRYPQIDFASTSVAEVAPGRFVLRGRLQLRGVTRPLDLDARLVGEHRDSAARNEVADFVVTGTLRRSEFGMKAEDVLISDRVRITINARIRLPQIVPAG